MNNYKHKVYIAGKITGTTDYIDRFAEGEKELKEIGFETIINPASMTVMLPGTLKHSEYLTITMAALSLCDTIYLLDGWNDSIGAIQELKWAIDHNLKIICQGEQISYEML